jgi:hypothetical protein
MGSGYNKAIIAGIFSGIILSLLSSLILAYHFTPIKISVIICGLCFIPYIVGLLTLGTGYLTVRSSMGGIRSRRDAIAISAVTGGIAGIIDNVLQIIIILVLHDKLNYYAAGFPGHDLSFFEMLPVVFLLSVVFIIMFNVVGGLLYISFKTKIK